MNNYYLVQRLVGVAVILFSIFFMVVSGDGTTAIFIPLGLMLVFSKMGLVDLDEYSGFDS